MACASVVRAVEPALGLGPACRAEARQHVAEGERAAELAQPPAGVLIRALGALLGALRCRRSRGTPRRSSDSSRSRCRSAADSPRSSRWRSLLDGLVELLAGEDAERRRPSADATRCRSRARPRGCGPPTRARGILAAGEVQERHRDGRAALDGAIRIGDGGFVRLVGGRAGRPRRRRSGSGCGRA